MLFKTIDEVKELASFIYASSNIDNLKTDIELAEKDIEDIIGSEIMQRAQNHYESVNYNKVDETNTVYIINNELIKKIQLPVVLFAYKAYAIHNDLTHSDKGRQIFVSDDEKPAFEWQIAKDDKALLDKAHRTTDQLIEFLDNNEDDLPEWKDSDNYKISKSLFINTAAAFSEIVPIKKSRRFFIQILPFIRDVERKHIKPILSVVLFDEIKAQILDDTLTERNTNYLAYINEPLALISMSIAYRRLSSDAFPNDVKYLEDKSSKYKSGMSAEDMSRSHKAEGLEELKKLQQLIARNNALDNAEEFIPTDPTERHNTENKFFRT